MKNYLNTISMQFRLMMNKKEFHLCYMINIGYILLTYVYYVIHYWGNDLSTIPSPSAAFALQASSKFFDIYINIVPFLAVLPFAMSFIDDNKNMLLPMLQIRSGVKTYYISKGIVCFIGGFVCFFIPLLIGILLNHLTFPNSGITFIGDFYDMNFDTQITGANVLIDTNWAGMWFPRLFINSPGIYNFLFCIIFSVCMGIFDTFIYVISFILKKQKLLLLLPLFLLISCLNIADQFSLEHTPYICYKTLLYVTVNAMYGKNPMYLYVFFLFIISFIFLGIYRQIHKDQLN